MTKPDWKDAPEWANWLVKGEDGNWWWHESIPDFFKGHWVSRLRRKIAAKPESINNFSIIIEQRPEQ